ncbi:MAG: CapA family protein [Planctomycetia bacterium]|nr:CapA family protein [Planctomycetia bacterium]
MHHGGIVSGRARRSWGIWLCGLCVPVAAAAEPSSTAPAARPPTAEAGMSIVFVGDIMLDGGPGHAVSSGRDPFAACGPLFADADHVVGNLECVLGTGGDRVLKPYTFRAAPAAIACLKRRFSALSLANNHSGDFGPEGLVETLRILDAAGIAAFGAGRTPADARRPLVLERNGFKVALLAANGFRARATAATADRAGSATLDEDLVLADIRAARREAAAVVPFVHWGPENTPQPRPAQGRLARRMIDAGAAAVIGAHPHVTQTVEVHRGAPIIYSLGNFVFDYFPEDPPEWIGWVVRLTLRPGQAIDLRMHAIRLDAAGIPHPVVEEDLLPNVHGSMPTAAPPVAAE